jgi:hypothetical protein
MREKENIMEEIKALVFLLLAAGLLYGSIQGKPKKHTNTKYTHKTH